MTARNFFRQAMGFVFLSMFFITAGCSTGVRNSGQLSIYKPPAQEADWIRLGEPLEFEGKLWFPIDRIEILLDSEVYLMGEFRDVQFFVDKVDVKPYDHLFTKFGPNHFRYFELRDK